jgi:hypothetical protein
MENRIAVEESAEESGRKTGLEGLEKAVKRLYYLIYWFANEMLKEEEQGRKNREKFERERKENPEKTVVMIDCSQNNAKCMKGCMKASIEAVNFLKDQRDSIEEWQTAGINAMFDQCKKEEMIPFDLPYAVKGLLLQWNETGKP